MQVKKKNYLAESSVISLLYVLNNYSDVVKDDFVNTSLELYKWNIKLLKNTYYSQAKKI